MNAQGPATALPCPHLCFPWYGVQVTVVHDDLRALTLDDATVITLYLLPEVLPPRFLLV